MTGKPKRQRKVTTHLYDRESGWHVIGSFTVYRSGRVVRRGEIGDFPTPEIAARLRSREDRLAALLWTRWWGVDA